MKRYLFFLLLVPLRVYGFADVTPDHPQFEALNYVQHQAIVQGYEDGSFHPEWNINRAEFTKIVIGASFSSAEIQNCHASLFPDVPQGSWFLPYVCVAQNRGIIRGYEDGMFRPAQSITFVEAAKVILNAFGYDTAPSTPWYQGFVEKLGELGAIPTSIQRLESLVTRGEMAQMIYRLKAGVRTKPSKSSVSFIPSQGQNTSVAAPRYETFTQGRFLEAKDSGRPFALYFHAPWCPSCVTFEGELERDLLFLPAGAVILKVDYDTSQALRSAYGVTYQHTGVFFDTSGNYRTKVGNVDFATLADLLEAE